MNPVWTIAKKRDGEELADAEIGHFIAGYVTGDIPDYRSEEHTSELQSH